MIIVCIILWLLALGAFSVWLYFRVNVETEYTLSNDSRHIGDAWYVTENRSDSGGLIWRIGDDNRVDMLYGCAEDPFLKGFWTEYMDLVGEESLAVIFSRDKDEDGVVKKQYVIAYFNESLQPNYLSPVFRFPQELNLTGFEVNEDMIYLTALSKNGQQAYVYEIPASKLMRIVERNADEEEKWKKLELNPGEFMTRESVWPRFFVQAEYADGQLNLRYDDGDAGYFSINRDAKAVFENKKVEPGMVIRAAGINPTFLILAGVIGSLVIVLIFVIFRERRRAVYVMACMEIFMLVLCGGSVLMLSRSHRMNLKEDFIRFARLDARSILDGYSLVDLNDEYFFERSDYEFMSARLHRRITDDTPVNDVLIVNAISGRVIASASGRNRDFVSDLYGSDVMDMLQDVAGGDPYSSMDTSVDGDDMTLVAINMADMGHATIAVIFQANGEGFFSDLVTGLKTYGGMIVLLFVIGSIIGIIFLVLQSRDLLKLQNALGELSRGTASRIDKPMVVGRDMNYMWNSIIEIRKNVANNNRIKFLTYEAYFRFAPKSIERILNRQSITEVHTGDISAKSGAIACLMVSNRSRNGKAELDNKNELLAVAEECREEYDGIFISHDNALSELKFLFLEDNMSAASFGTELILKLREMRGRGLSHAGMFIHYAPYTYGVAGDKKQAAVYLSSPESDVLAAYGKWFREMRLGLIVTKELIEHEDFRGESRYIGFILPDPSDRSRRIELYEILDAEISAVRNLRTGMKNRFKEALNLYYEKDFYFARNSFTEVLKVSPDDEISKWYLFECERQLNNENSATEFVGNIHL